MRCSFLRPDGAAARPASPRTCPDMLSPDAAPTPPAGCRSREGPCCAPGGGAHARPPSALVRGRDAPAPPPARALPLRARTPAAGPARGTAGRGDAEAQPTRGPPAPDRAPPDAGRPRADPRRGPERNGRAGLPTGAPWRFLPPGPAWGEVRAFRARAGARVSGAAFPRRPGIEPRPYSAASGRRWARISSRMFFAASGMLVPGPKIAFTPAPFRNS